MENFDMYISNNGYLVIPEYNIKYLIDFYESSIPIMPEAVESTIRAAGRDGDYVLKTTYEPIPFNIVCYTDEGLTVEEKILQETQINTFLNSIKEKTKRLAFEKDNKFYNVKYSGALVTSNYPAHLKFSIPLKSSDSYAKDVTEKSITGNNSAISQTVKSAGAIFTIEGPAQDPIISLNDYAMEYNMSILEGSKVEIDTNRSTIININSQGMRSNVMKYYNHQFPKIEYGENTLKVLGGVDNEEQVTVRWHDLRL